MNAVFYSLAFQGSQVAPVQLVKSLMSLRALDRDTPVFVFLFGQAPPGFLEAVHRLNATVRDLGDYTSYIISRQPERGHLYALDPKIHRWLVLGEPELRAFDRILYIDSDTAFFSPVNHLFQRYSTADLYAREEPFSSRSWLGYNQSYLDETKIDELRDADSSRSVPPFNTGVCLLSRAMADGIGTILPHYFDTLFRFLSWFYLNPLAQPQRGNTSLNAVYDNRFRPDESGALPYPSENRWIVDQVSMWLAMARLPTMTFADFSPADVCQGAEFHRLPSEGQLPMLCHYFSSNMTQFFEWAQRLRRHS